MKRWRRRILLATFYIGSLAGVAVLTAYYTRNFTGRGPTPGRAGFARRLPGVDDGDYRRYPFFFATNRAKGDNSYEGEGKSLGDRITTGTYEARIARKLPVEPWAWEDAGNIKLVNRAELPEDECLARLRDAVQRSPHRSVLVLVWGWKDRFRSAALKTAYTAYVLDIDTPVLLFDWPANQGDDPRGYLASQQMAQRSGADLGRVLSRVVREAGADNVWLMGSSMGCQTICDAFTWMGQQPDLADGDGELAHVVFAAPDVAANEFDEQFAGEIAALSRHLTAYVSSNDQALLLSQWVNRGRRLGRVPVAQPVGPRSSPEGERQFEEAAELLDLQAAGARGLAVVDATPVNKTRNMHHYFTDSTEFFDDLYRHLLRPDDMVSRRLYAVRVEDRATFWILWDQ